MSRTTEPMGHPETDPRSPEDQDGSPREHGPGSDDGHREPLMELADLDRLRSALEHTVRTRPVTSLLLCVAAGWLVGRALR